MMLGKQELSSSHAWLYLLICDAKGCEEGGKKCIENTKMKSHNSAISGLSVYDSAAEGE